MFSPGTGFLLCSQVGDARGGGSVSNANKAGGRMNAPLRLLFSHVLHAVAFAFDDNRFAVMEQSVEYCACGGAVVVEYLGPLFKWAIAGDYQRAAFISFRYDLEEQIRAELVYREIS